MGCDLVVAWSGELEARGDAPGLSSYRGRSSIFHSPSDEEAEQRLGRQIDNLRRRDRHKGIRVAPVRERAARGQFEQPALTLLRKGLSYGMTARELGCVVTVVRNVARRNGIDRRGCSNCRAHRPAVL